MRAREVRVAGMPGLDDRRAEPLGEGDEMLDRAHAPSHFFGHDQGTRGAGEDERQLVDGAWVGRGRVREARGGRRIGRQRLEQEFHRDRDEDRPLRRRHRQLTRPLDRRRQDRGRVEGKAPLHRGLHEPRGAADVGQQANPLVSEVVVGALAEPDGLAREHDHRDLLVKRSAERHGGVEGADGGVDHHGGKLSRRLHVAAGHRHRDLLVARREIERDLFGGSVRFCEVLPDGRPLRAGRREDPLDAHLGQEAQERFGPAQSFRVHAAVLLSAFRGRRRRRPDRGRRSGPRRR